LKSDPYDEKEPAEVGSYRIATCARQDMRTGASLSFILGDHLGSTSSIVNASGQEVARSLYKAWGETRFTSGALPTKYTYTGQYSNVSDFGLMYYNARWYDPYLTQFSQPDTFIPDLNNPQDWNRYFYARNNPIKYVDPSGHKACVDFDEYGGCIRDPYWTPGGLLGGHGNGRDDEDDLNGNSEDILIRIGNGTCDTKCQQVAMSLGLVATTLDFIAMGLNMTFALVVDVSAFVAPQAYLPLLAQYQSLSIIPNSIGSAGGSLWILQGFVTGESYVGLNITDEQISFSGAMAQDTAASILFDGSGWLIREPTFASLVNAGGVAYDMGRNPFSPSEPLIPSLIQPNLSVATNFVTGTISISGGLFPASSNITISTTLPFP